MGRINLKRILLIILLVVGVIAAGVLLFNLSFTETNDDKQKTEEIKEDAAEEPQATLFFASDYQAEKGWDEPKTNLITVISAAKEQQEEIDGAIICGDYTNDRKLYNYQIKPDESIREIIDVFKNNFEGVNEKDMLFVQGNHDYRTDMISESGLHEYDDYLVYVVNTESDFPWNQGKTSGCLDKVKKTAKDMDECFNMLINRGETRPVIIAGHVPLHFSGRTSSLNGTGDNLYSSLIFDVVNNAGKTLDIIYIFGHNHRKGWDCYLGQSSVYKQVSDEILIPKFADSDVVSNDYSVETLEFTYMNAGYIGHCMNCSPEEVDNGTVNKYAAADNTLTATVCEIYKDKIILKRFSKDGLHQMGSAGDKNPYRDDTQLISNEYYSVEVESPQTVTRK